MNTLIKVIFLLVATGLVYSDFVTVSYFSGSQCSDSDLWEFTGYATDLCIEGNIYSCDYTNNLVILTSFYDVDCSNASYYNATWPLNTCNDIMKYTCSSDLPSFQNTAALVTYSSCANDTDVDPIYIVGFPVNRCLDFGNGIYVTCNNSYINQTVFTPNSGSSDSWASSGSSNSWGSSGSSNSWGSSGWSSNSQSWGSSGSSGSWSNSWGSSGWSSSNSQSWGSDSNSNNWPSSSSQESSDSWSSDEWSSDNWSSDSQESSENWSSDNWSSENWSSENWSSDSQESSDNWSSDNWSSESQESSSSSDICSANGNIEYFTFPVKQPSCSNGQYMVGYCNVASSSSN